MLMSAPAFVSTMRATSTPVSVCPVGLLCSTTSVLQLMPVSVSKLEFQWHPTLKKTYGKIKELGTDLT
jgi:hypothetical protein